MEQLLGGQGSKVLSALFNKRIRDVEENEYTVLKSDIYLEISNGENTNTIWRSVGDDIRNDKLVTVYNQPYEFIHSVKSESQDYYLHDSGSAQKKLGFFKYLENFLGFKLPNVPNYNNGETKLYLQNIFGSCIIEQKRAWSDILTGIPNLGIKEAKRRTIEFVLKLDSLDNEKKRTSLNDEKKQLSEQWKERFIKIQTLMESKGLRIVGITEEININNFDKIHILDIESGKRIDEKLDEYLQNIKSIN